MQGHVIVCGLQGVGLRAVEQFSPQRHPGCRHRRRCRSPLLADPRRLGRSPYPTPRPPRRGIRRSRARPEPLRLSASRSTRSTHSRQRFASRRLRPELPLVVQLANPSVANALERVSGPGSVLDVASLAAPSFVEACLGRPSHAIELAGIDFAVVQLAVEPTDARARHLPGPLRAPRPRGHHAVRRRADGDAVPVATTRCTPATASRCSARWTNCGRPASARQGRPMVPPARSSWLRRLRLQVGHRARRGQPGPCRGGNAAVPADRGGDHRACTSHSARDRTRPTSASSPRSTSPSRRWRRWATGTTASPGRAPGCWPAASSSSSPAWRWCRPPSRSSPTSW